MSKFFDQEVFPVRCLFTHFIFTCAMQYFIGKSLIEEKKRICFETGWFVLSVSIEFNMILSEIRKLTNKKKQPERRETKNNYHQNKTFSRPPIHFVTHFNASSHIKYEIRICSSKFIWIVETWKWKTDISNYKLSRIGVSVFVCVHWTALIRKLTCKVFSSSFDTIFLSIFLSLSLSLSIYSTSNYDWLLFGPNDFDVDHLPVKLFSHSFNSSSQSCSQIIGLYLRIKIFIRIDFHSSTQFPSLLNLAANSNLIQCHYSQLLLLVCVRFFFGINLHNLEISD